MSSSLQRLLEHLPLLLRVGRRMTKSDVDAEDLAQETLLRALDRVGEVRDPEKLRGWLLAVQRSVFLNGRRGLRAKFEVIQGGQSAPEPSANLEDEVMRNALDDTLLQALETLPDTHREALWMREVDELSYAEIALAQGCPVGTVRSRLARAREALLQALTNEVSHARM